MEREKTDKSQWLEVAMRLENRSGGGLLSEQA